jgi:hypothetical protein
MVCSRCGSASHNEVNAEVYIHFPGRAGLNKAGVLVFPRLLLCLGCGLTGFSVPESELQKLASATKHDRDKQEPCLRPVNQP